MANRPGWSNIHWIFKLVIGVGLLLIALLSWNGHQVWFGRATARQPLPPAQGEAAIELLKQRGEYASLQQAMRAVRYSVSWAAKAPLAGGGAYEAVNAEQSLRAYFTPEGVTVMGREDGPSWRTGLSLRAVGRAGQMAAVSAAEVSAQGARASLRRQIETQAQATQIEEWYENRADGLEQGFTLAARPAGTGAEVQIELDVTGDLTARASGAGLELSGRGVHLRYDGLKSWDAMGRELPTRLELDRRRVYLAVADAEAVYPLTIDPTITQIKQLTASDGAANDQFGISVAVDGDTIVVGGWQDDVGANADQGSAYVFSRNQGGANNWGEVKKLTASDGAAVDEFGRSVAVNGDTIVVGSITDMVGANSQQGSAYVFSRNQGGANNWGEVKKLIASDGAAIDNFGLAAAVDGDTIVVGAFSDGVGVNNVQGSAYVFSRNQGGANNWGEVKKLIASDGAAIDEFGWSVAVNGDTIVVGSLLDDVGANANQGSAYVFSRNQGGANNWGEVKKLIASDGTGNASFGGAVAVDGDTIVVGAAGANANQGSAYVFSLNQGGANNWGEVKKLIAPDGAANDSFGVAVAVDGDTIVVGVTEDNTKPGFAYVFSRNQGGVGLWGQLKKLTALDGAANDTFGIAVAVDGDTIVIGAYQDNVGANSNQGSAHIYGGLDCDFTEQAHPIASDGAANDWFGRSVAVDGDTIVVGAQQDNVLVSGTLGAAYVFSRNQGGTGVWGVVKKLTASDGAVGDFFGYDVALDGDTIVVGAERDTVGANFGQGSAYIYSRNQGGANNWGEVKRLTASDGLTNDGFGRSVAVDGDTIVVGAWADDVGANVNQGSAYVFSRNQGGANNWGEGKRLNASDGMAIDRFGQAVAVDGDTIVVGAWLDNLGANANQGAAYVFSRDQGGANNWGEVKRLNASDGEEEDRFGHAVAVDGDTIVVGAYYDDVGTGGDQGSAYVFSRNQDGANNWGEVKHLIALGSTSGPDMNFGRSVAVDGDTIVVGANQDDVGANLEQGAAYVFSRNQGGVNNWGQLKRLTASDGAQTDTFGRAVAVDGDTIAVGAPLDNVGANANQGSAYIFSAAAVCPPTITAGLPVTRQAGSPAVNSTIATVSDLFDGTLSVSATTVPSGISVTNIVNTGGTVTADVAAACAAAIGANTVVLTVTNTTTGLSSAANLTVNVEGNTAPLVTYGNVSVNGGASTTNSPITATDNGSITGYTVQSQGMYTGAISVDGSGVVSIGNAAPVGMHTITIRATDNCGATTDAMFTLTVNNNAPTITAGATLTRQQASAGTVSIIAIVNDGETPVGNLIVTATTVPAGITVTGITNANGTISATVAADCTATIGNNTVVLNVTDGNSETATANLTVTVTANSAPSVTYANASVNAGGSTTNSTTSATDNGSITGYAVQSPGTYTSTISVDASGVVSISNAAPVGSHTITIRATDNCGATTDATFTLTVGNNPPTITAGAALTRQQASAGTVSPIATVSDGETPAGSLVVTATTVPAGITVTGITNANGTISANVAADCTATVGANTVVLTVTDSNNGTVTANLTVNVTANSAPSLSYPISGVALNSATTINPTTATDNGSITGYQIVSVTPPLTVAPTVNSSGVVLVTDAGPFGLHTVTVRATDNCGATTEASFTLNVGCGSLTVNPATLINGLTFVPYSSTLSASGGSGAYTFTLASGTLPAGLSLGGDTISGTPNTAGASTFTIRATDENGCIGERSYTLLIGSTGLMYYPLARPVRLLDTRPGASANACFQPNAPIPGGTVRTQPARGTCEGLTIPPSATTITGNITTVQSGGGFLAIYPSDAPPPLVANSNYLPSEIVNNSFTVGVGAADGAVNISVTTDTDVVVDVTGYYAPPTTGGLYFHPLPRPVRLLETRQGFTGCFASATPLPGGVNTTQQGTGSCQGLTIPAEALALVGNATTVNPSALGYLTLYPADAAQPLVASSNYGAGQTVNGPFTVGLSPSGQFKIFPQWTTDLVIDITGYYSAQANDANGQGLLYSSLGSPLRLLDTRAGLQGCYTPGAVMVGGTVYTQETQSPCTNLTPTARALIGNATVVNTADIGYLTFWPGDAQQPLVATSNYVAGQVINRYFTVGLGPDGSFKRFASSTTNLVVDISGFFAP